MVRALFAVLFVAAPGAAQSNRLPIFDVTAKAAKAGSVTPTQSLRKGLNVPVSVDMPGDGSILVGFDFGLGRVDKSEVIFAVRPIYRNALKEWSASEYGAMTGAKSNVVRRVRVVAREGFAVGGLVLTSGEYVTGASLIFMKIGSADLDPEDSYTSDWVGDRNGAFASYSGDGAPAIGMFAARRETKILALGLNFARSPDAPRPKKTGPEVIYLAEEARAFREAALQAQQQPPADSRKWIWVISLGTVALAGLFASIIARSRRARPDGDETIHPVRLPDAAPEMAGFRMYD